MHWQDVEPNPGQFDFQADDALIASTRANQLNVLAILAYSTTWSTSAPSDPPGNLTHFPPRAVTDWAHYVAAVMTRYKNDVHYWEVWNEPDLAEFWNGTPAQCAALLAVTSSTIMQIDPTATVVLGGQAVQHLPGHPAGEFLTQILPDADHPAASNFDIAAFHYYLPPNAAPQHFAEFKAALTRFGIGDRPIWITEAGLPTCPALVAPDQDRALETQAQWLDQTPPSLVDLGASRVFWFQLDESPYARAAPALTSARVPRTWPFKVSRRQVAA